MRCARTVLPRSWLDVQRRVYLFNVQVLTLVYPAQKFASSPEQIREFELPPETFVFCIDDDSIQRIVLRATFKSLGLDPEQQVVLQTCQQ